MFLETITMFGNDVLVPINRIRYVSAYYERSYQIKITSDQDVWIECFDDKESWCERYAIIKNILKAV